MNYPNAGIRRRNERLIIFYHSGISRKQLALRFRLTYELVKKILCKIERRRYPR